MKGSIYTRARTSAPLSAVGIIVLMAALLLGTSAGPGQAPARTGPAELPAAPVQFEPNVGQANEYVSYVARMPGGTLYFGKSDLLIAADNRGAEGRPAAVKMEFVGANDSPAIEAGSLLPGKLNYLVGNDRSRWRTGVPTYGAVTYLSLYNGVDLEYVGQPGQVEGIYSLAPGADPGAIRWRYESAREVAVDGKGNLQVTAGSSDEAVFITEHTPFAWQTIEGKQVPVNVRYEVAADNTIAFALGAYDRAQALMIDPVLTFSTFLGGNADDDGRGIAVDAAGNIYVAGETASTNFPVVGGFQTTNQGGSDAFVTKFNATGGVVYSTYLGGGGSDEGMAVAVDAAGSAYVAGITNSSNFPTQNGYQASDQPQTDAFITKLAADGASLLYSSYFGAGLVDSSSGIAIDGANGAYIVGRTTSTNLPTRNAYQATYGGSSDGFLAKFNTAASGDTSLVYATYLGGSGQEWVGTTGYGLGDWGHGVAADAQGNAYITGHTLSANFPVRNAYQPALSGIADGFVSKINTLAAGDASLVYSTFLGGTALDMGKDVAVDGAGNAYVTGETGSSNFPTLNRYAPCVNGPFVTKLNPAGNALVYSTCFGQGATGRAPDIAVDGAGNAYVVGSTSSATFPVVDPIQGTIGGASDAFVLKLSAAGNSLIYSTFLGGAQGEQGIGVATNGAGKTYVTGDTLSANFPVQNAYQSQCVSCPTSSDGFVTSIQESVVGPSPTPSNTPTRTPTRTVTPTRTPTSVPGNNPPVLIVPLNYPYRVGVEIGNYLALRFDASDPDAGDIVSMSAQGLPSGASFPNPTPGNPIYSTFTWRPTSADIGTYFVTITATDNHGAQDSATVQIDVVPGCVPYFSDVFPNQYFYDGVRYLFCHSVVVGYIEPDLTFTYRPFNNTTRSQFSKMIALAYNLPAYNPPIPDFVDVPADNTFYSYVEAAFHAGIIRGYPCGGPGEPCDPQNRPYFRPYGSITRGQLSKLVVLAAGWPIDTTGGPHFADVPTTDTFYEVIETAFNHALINGYPCGGAFEPCDSQNRPYFRTGNPTIRGQIAKILYIALGSPPQR